MFRKSMIPFAASTLAVGLLGAMAPSQAATTQAPSYTCHGKKATIVGTMNDDRIRGTKRRDVIVGLGGNDTIRAMGGNDIICGNVGADDLFGGKGNDVLLGGLDQANTDPEWDEYWADLIQGGPGNDLIDPGPAQRGHLPDVVLFNKAKRGMKIDLAKGTARGEGRDRIRPGWVAVVGSRHDDIIRGSARGEVLLGFGGGNKIFGGGGADTVQPDGGWLGEWGYNGYKEGPVRKSLLVGGPGIDDVNGNPIDDVRGGTGEDSLSGSMAVRGGPGNDDLWVSSVGRKGQIIDGGAGRDEVDFDVPRKSKIALETDLRTGRGSVVGTKTTFRFANVESMVLDNRRTPWTAHGTAKKELFSTGGPLTVHAGGGADVIFSGDHDDYVDGGSGADRANTGNGDDVCVNVERIQRKSCHAPE